MPQALKDSVKESSTTKPPVAGRTLRTAIIGGGCISEQHLTAIAKRSDVVIAGLCDLSPSMAKFSAERFGVEAWFTDHREMLDASQVDVVHVLTPAATHVPIVQDCIERHVNVIVEKPIALSNADFQMLWRHASARNLRLIENQNYRFNSVIERLAALAASGRLGDIREIDVELSLNIRGGGRYADENLPHPSHTLPGGVIHEFIPHLCSLLLHVLPERETEGDVIHAIWRNRGGGSLFKYDDLDAAVQFGETLGRIRFSSFQWPDRFIVRVHGTQGVAAAELFQPSWQCATQHSAGHHLTPFINSIAGARHTIASGVGNIWRKVRNRTAYEGLERFLNLTYDALANGTPPPIGYDDMNRTSRLIDALLPEVDRA